MKKLLSPALIALMLASMLVAVQIPDACKAAVKAGRQIGFAIQINDDINRTEKRDALLRSKNITGAPGRSAPSCFSLRMPHPKTSVSAEVFCVTACIFPAFVLE